MISISAHLPQPIQVPQCFINWVKEREALKPTFSFIVNVIKTDDASASGWRLKNNVVTYNRDGFCYGVRILTGGPMHKRDLDPAIGFDRDTLPTVAPFIYTLPLPEEPSELVSFEARSYDTLAELDKSYEASKRSGTLPKSPSNSH